MKVCTDACLLGAYTASKLQGTEKNILDIGAGTSLLSLMLAQKSSAHIDAVELNEAAAAEASANVVASPWASQVNVLHIAIQSFEPGKKYDLIISNPPFFEADLRSADQTKNDAKHDSGLTLSDLIHIITKLLSDNGTAALLLPFARTNFVTSLATDAGLFVQSILKVKPSPVHDFFRTILVLGKTEKHFINEELCIHNEQREYSAGFTSLLKDYYLKL